MMRVMNRVGGFGQTGGGACLREKGWTEAGLVVRAPVKMAATGGRGAGLGWGGVRRCVNQKEQNVAEERRDGVREVKFLLPAEKIEAVLGWMRSQMQPDPHGGGSAGDAYRVESLYFDTPGFDVYHRRGSFGRAKFRIRRYGEAAEVFLERKLKRGGLVRKRRLGVEPAALGQFAIPVNGHRWAGSWFQRRAELRALRPVVMMNYQRIARLGVGEEGRFRVTLDRDLRAVRAEGVQVPARIEGPDLLEGRAVLEVKFAEALPAAFRRMVEELGLEVGGFSKFRTGVLSCGWVTVPPESAEPVDPVGSPLASAAGASNLPA